MQADNTPATAITSGDGTIITFGSFRFAAEYSDFIDDVSFDGSTGSVL
jgi:hypothetical protein